MNEDQRPTPPSPMDQFAVDDRELVRIATERIKSLETRLKAATGAIEGALRAMKFVRVFVTSRERVKHPEGIDLYDETIAMLENALAQERGESDVSKG